MLKSTATMLAAGILSPWHLLSAPPSGSRFRIGACDWSIGMRGKVGAMAQAKAIGLDGVQLSYIASEESPSLRDKSLRKAYQREAQKQGVAVGGIALGIMNQIPYKSDPRAEQWVLESIPVAKKMGVGVILLAFFGEGDIKGDPQGTREVIRRLKIAAPVAEKAGVILGVESWLSAEEHVAILDAVGSSHVQVYYDVANSHKMGYDIYEEIRWLGKSRICEFHCKENGYLLGTGPIDFAEVRRAIEDIDYSGWVMIEGAIPEGADMLPSYRSNLQVMRALF
jgi:sugar phosphate isomerase/epimerase